MDEGILWAIGLGSLSLIVISVFYAISLAVRALGHKLPIDKDKK